jgi:hypothetical protein
MTAIRHLFQQRHPVAPPDVARLLDAFDSLGGDGIGYYPS